MSRIFCIVFFSIMVGACSQTLSVDERNAIRTIVVVDEYPLYPSFIRAVPDIVDVVETSITDRTLHDFMLDEVRRKLEASGYSVFVDDKADMGKADHIIELRSHTSSQIKGVEGYGFYMQSYLGGISKNQAFATISLLSYSGDSDFCDRCTASRSIDIVNSRMPDNWIELQAEDKKILRDALREVIRLTVDDALDQTGLLQVRTDTAD